MSQAQGSGIPGILRTLREYLAFYCGLGLLASVSLLWSVLALPLSLVLPRKWKKRTGRLVITMGFRIYLRALSIMGACRFDLKALDTLQGESPMIIAPNHPSLMDALMVISCLPNLACIMKSELVDNVFFGAGARLAGYIRNDSLRGMIYLAVEDLRSGSHLLLFPEGTRSNRLPIGTVRGSIALIAKEAGVPIQTVLIETDSAFLTKGWPFFRKPSMPIHYRIHLGQRFDPPTDVRVFTAELESYFQSALVDAKLPHLPAATDVHSS
ncbi:MAG: lysophospholipid acyltransferase family protein [Acidithiobacillus ferrooxidans]